MPLDGLGYEWVVRGSVLTTAVITALLVSRARTREVQARNNALLRALPDLMFVQTRDGVYLDYSAREESVLVASPSFFIGKNMRDILPPHIADAFTIALERLFAGEEPVLVEYDIPVKSALVQLLPR